MIYSGIKPMFPPQMLDELCFAHEVVWTCLWWIKCFSSWNRQGTLADSVLKIKKKKLRLTSEKEMLRTAPAESLSSWTVHEHVQIMWTCSWTVHEQVQIFVVNIWINSNSFIFFEDVHDSSHLNELVIDEIRNNTSAIFSHGTRFGQTESDVCLRFG